MERIGEVRNSAIGSTQTIAPYDHFDLDIALRSLVRGLSIDFGADTVFDKRPPVVTNAGAFNTYPDTYDVLGRTFGASVTLRC